MLEQRKSIRRRTLLNGRVHVQKLNGWALDCRVRNVSDGGVGLDVPVRPIIPQSFEIGVSGHLPRPARLVWYADGQAGATFETASLADAGSGAACALAAAAPRDETVLQARIRGIVLRRQRGPRA